LRSLRSQFGGRSGIYGRLDAITTGITSSLTADNTMVGLGAAPEAIETNPLDYDLLFDHVFNAGPHDVPSYALAYSGRRYKTSSGDAAAHLAAAWGALLPAYAAPDSQEGGSGSVFALRPVFNGTQLGCCALLNMYYDPQIMVDALGSFLQAGDADPSLRDQASYRFEVVNVAVQAVSNEALRLYALMNEGDGTSGVAENKDYFLRLLDQADLLLQDQPERMLGFWIENARLAGSDGEEADSMEHNARLIVTMWGDPGSSLNEYAWRMWAGMLSTFYRPRWEKFFAAVEGGLDQAAFTAQIKDWEEQWTKLTVDDVRLSSEPSGGGLEAAEQVFELLAGVTGR
jgi:alpha-N-acetylglucosaminidase